MKKCPISVQLYSLREASKADFPGVLKKVAAAGYAGVEFAGLYGLTPKQVRTIIDGLGLKASSTHGGMPTKENIGEIASAAHTLGYTWHIVPGYAKEGFASLEGCKKTAQEFQAAAELLKKEGLKFAFHNHGWEYESKIDGKHAMEVVLANAPDAYAQIDTYWAATAGANVPEVMKRLGKQVALLHIKDGPMVHGKPMTAVGEGKMNWGPIMAATDGTSLEWLVVELDECATDMMAAVEKSVKYLVDKGYGTGKQTK
jgi:sugar phosphate isomerase/epimerase